MVLAQHAANKALPQYGVKEVIRQQIIIVLQFSA
jgi:hypothetical protein